jgi:hypothetical protein
MGTNTIPQKVVTLLNGISGAGPTTSAALDIAGVRKCNLFFTRAAGTTGNSDMTVTMSADGTNYIACNMMISNVTNVQAIATGNITRVATLNNSTNATKFLTLDMDYVSACKYIKAVWTNTSGTDDGVMTVKAVLEYY